VVSAQQCRENSTECVTLANDPDISIPRSNILLAISRDWRALATKMDEYEALLKKEDRSR
jgi:hypothetical protein